MLSTTGIIAYVVYVLVLFIYLFEAKRILSTRAKMAFKILSIYLFEAKKCHLLFYSISSYLHSSLYIFHLPFLFLQMVNLFYTFFIHLFICLLFSRLLMYIYVFICIYKSSLAGDHH